MSWSEIQRATRAANETRAAYDTASAALAALEGLLACAAPRERVALKHAVRIVALDKRACFDTWLCAKGRLEDLIDIYPTNGTRRRDDVVMESEIQEPA